MAETQEEKTAIERLAAMLTLKGLGASHAARIARDHAVAMVGTGNEALATYADSLIAKIPRDPDGDPIDGAAPTITRPKRQEIAGIAEHIKKLQSARDSQPNPLRDAPPATILRPLGGAA